MMERIGGRAQGQMSQGGCGFLFEATEPFGRRSLIPGGATCNRPCCLASVSGSLPILDGGIPGWGTIDLQIDDHLLEFGVIGLGHLVLHERLRTFLPHLVVQNALWVVHILDQRSLNECLFLHDVCEDFLQFRSELLLRRLIPHAAEIWSPLVSTAFSIALSITLCA